jgi:HPt (histidine-containing phosphotransfer) domain-containing protein
MVEPIISEFHDDPDMAELLMEFSESLQETCEKLQQALREGNVEEIRRIGHQLKGSGGGYGYPQITEAGGALEDAIRSAGAVNDDVRSRAHTLMETCAQARLGLE